MKDRTFRMGIMKGADSLGHVIGNILGGKLYNDYANFYLNFSVSCGISVLCIMFVLCLFVESVEIGEEDVFTNGSLPTSLSSAPLLPLYQIVVRQDFHTSLIVNFLHIFWKLIKRTKQ